MTSTRTICSVASLLAAHLYQRNHDITTSSEISYQMRDLYFMNYVQSNILDVNNVGGIIYSCKHFKQIQYMNNFINKHNTITEIRESVFLFLFPLMASDIFQWNLKCTKDKREHFYKIQLLNVHTSKLTTLLFAPKYARLRIHALPPHFVLTKFRKLNYQHVSKT